jgi:hypothetical protein
MKRVLYGVEKPSVNIIAFVLLRWISENPIEAALNGCEANNPILIELGKKLYPQFSWSKLGGGTTGPILSELVSNKWIFRPSGQKQGYVLSEYPLENIEKILLGKPSDNLKELQKENPDLAVRIIKYHKEIKKTPNVFKNEQPTADGLLDSKIHRFYRQYSHIVDRWKSRALGFRSSLRSGIVLLESLVVNAARQAGHLQSPKGIYEVTCGLDEVPLEIRSLQGKPLILTPLQREGFVLNEEISEYFKSLGKLKIWGSKKIESGLLEKNNTIPTPR